jgi:hypothetical protein
MPVYAWDAHPLWYVHEPDWEPPKLEPPEFDEPDELPAPEPDPEPVWDVEPFAPPVVCPPDPESSDIGMKTVWRYSRALFARLVELKRSTTPDSASIGAIHKLTSIATGKQFFSNISHMSVTCSPSK